MQDPIIGEQYMTWLEGRFLGVCTYVDDQNIGPAFIRLVVDEKGRVIHQVFTPDWWEIVSNQ